MKRASLLLLSVAAAAAAAVGLWRSRSRSFSQPPNSAPAHAALSAQKTEVFSPPRDERRTPIRESTRFALSLVGAPNGLRGDGALFVRPLNERPGTAARELEVRAWEGSFYDGSWRDLAIVAAVVDGVPMRILDGSNPAQVRIAASNDALLLVVDAKGELLDDVTVAEDRHDNIAPADGLLHPGVVYSGQNVVTGAGSPVWLVRNGDPALYWVGGAGHTYSALLLRPSESRFRRIALDPAGTLEVHLDDVVDPKDFAVRVTYPERVLIDSDRLYKREFSIGGLPPGTATVSLVAHADAEGPAHASAGIRIEAGATIRLALRPNAVRVAQQGSLAGELRIPELPPYLRADDVQLAITYVRRQDGSAVSGAAARRIAIADMVPSGRSLAWGIDATDPGGYRLEVQPLGYVVNAWVEPNQSSMVVVDVPELSQLTVRFIDEDTGVPQTVAIRTASREVESHGEIFSPVSFWRIEPNAGGIVFCGVPGRLTFSVEAGEHGMFWYTTDTTAGAHKDSVRMPLASWIELAFVHDPSDPTSGCKWYGDIEVLDVGGRVEPLWTESRLIELRGRSVSLCLRGSGAVELRFVPESGYPQLAPIRVGPGVPDTDGRTRPRRVLVPAGETSAIAVPGREH